MKLSLSFFSHQSDNAGNINGISKDSETLLPMF